MRASRRGGFGGGRRGGWINVLLVEGSVGIKRRWWLFDGVVLDMYSVGLGRVGMYLMCPMSQVPVRARDGPSSRRIPAHCCT